MQNNKQENKTKEYKADIEEKISKDFGRAIKRLGSEDSLLDNAVRDICSVSVAPASKSKVREILQKTLDTQEEELLDKFRNDPKYQTPMGVSQWMNHGEEYGYDKFWKKKLLNAQLEATLEMIDGMKSGEAQDYYCTYEHLGYHDKHCNGCERNRVLEEVKDSIKKKK